MSELLEQRPTRFQRHQAMMAKRAVERQADEVAAAVIRAAEVLARTQHRREKRAALVRHHAAKRRAEKLKRTPPWADLESIRCVYERARELTATTGIVHHVDHEIPLQGELGSGLHVHLNLQILTGSENSKKSNKFEPGDL